MRRFFCLSCILPLPRALRYKYADAFLGASICVVIFFLTFGFAGSVKHRLLATVRLHTSSHAERPN